MSVKCFKTQSIKEILNSILSSMENRLKKETKSEHIIDTKALWDEMWKTTKEDDGSYEKLKSFYEFFEKTAFSPVENPPEELDTIKKRSFVSAVLIATNRLKAPAIMKDEVEKIVSEFDKIHGKC